MSQLALPIGLADHAVFDSFHAAGNRAAVEHLRSLAAGTSRGGAWVCGPAGSGKSHLLQAACAAAGDEAVYLTAGLLSDTGPGLIEGLEARRLVCIDDIHRLVGRPEWERALFLLYNELAAQGGSLVPSAPMSPRECPVQLADLASRLTQLPAYRLQPLTDDERLAALRLRAAQRGLELPDDAGRYLLTRARRDMASLYALLDTLDREALKAQRKLTVPFVREVLSRTP